jgi:hypothetical protein
VSRREPWPEENPFSTRRIRPGAIPYYFPPGDKIETLLARLEASEWQGEILGRHGSGKSALLATLIPAIDRAGRTVVLIGLHDHQRQLPIDLAHDARVQKQTVVVIDGYEQLSGWSRRALSSTRLQRGFGLVVTAHMPVGLPLLYRTTPDYDAACRLVEHLLPQGVELLSQAELEQCYLRHAGNLREMLFELYDMYEQRRPRDSNS